MKSLVLTFICLAILPLGMMAQGWPQDYGGVMLGLLQRHAMDTFREAGRRTGYHVRPRLGASERQLRRHIDGLRRHVLV